MLDKKLKSFSFELKDLDGKKGIVQFYGSAFGTTKADADSDGDIILKGSFKKTISEQTGRIKHCLNHSVYDVPGVFSELKEDSFGLLCTSQLAKGSNGDFSTLAKDTLINYEAGVITEHSIGYRATKEAYDEQEQCNFISEIKLWEVSSLTGWGANKNTPFVGLKSAADLLEQLKAIDKVLHSTSISDEGAIQLLKYSDQINIFLKALKAKMKKPEESTSKLDEAIDYNFLKQNFNL
jgi:HK97 family phage prohead protease